MRPWIALASVIFLSAGSSAGAADSEFLERFALADIAQRERLLQELVAGTEDFDYFHCLHYQNTRNTDALEEALTAWRKRSPAPSEARREIELREAILTYPENRKESLKTLSNHFKLDFDRVPENAPRGDGREFPTRLDPARITAEAFLAAASINARTRKSITEDSAAWILSPGRVPPPNMTRRWLLEKITRPDATDLTEVTLDLMSEDSEGFGSLPIHRQLFLNQLDILMRNPKLKLEHDSSFVNTYLAKLRPSSMEAGTENGKREAYLRRAWDFAKKLPPSMGRKQAHILRHWLALDLEQHGRVDRDRLMSYIKLPRKLGYVNQTYLESCEEKFSLGANLTEHTGLEKFGPDDEPLVRELFLSVFRSGDDYRPYEKYVRSEWLRPLFAEARFLAGKGDPEKLFSMLEPSGYQKITERVDVKLAADNPRRLAVDEELELRVGVKNVPKLIVNVFEINALNYFLETGRDLDTPIDLDGLVASAQTTYEYDEPPVRLVERTFKFPQLTGKRGAWVIEFVGNGKSSRALVRKGELHAVPRITAAGHAFRVFDANRKPVERARIWLAGHEFKPDKKSGEIFVPFSTKPGRVPIIVTDGEFAVLDRFDHREEKYEFSVAMFVDRESLIAGNTAELILRPQLFVSGEPTDLALLQEVTLSIESTNLDGIRTVERIAGLKLDPQREFVHRFVVPERLHGLRFALDAEVESLSAQTRVSVRDSKDIDINGLDKSDQVRAAHVLKSGDDYVIEVLGKNGEPQPGHPVSIEFSHRMFSREMRLQFRTDGEGKVFLGELPDIEWVKTTVDLVQEPWMLLDRERFHDVPSSVHLAAGEIFVIPAASVGVDRRKNRYSLIEMRGDLPVRNWISALSIDAGGNLTITGLQAGEYQLRTPQEKVAVLVSPDKPGDVGSRILATDGEFLEHSTNKVPIGLKIEDPADGKLRLRLDEAGNRTRVHVVASRYASRFFFGRSLSGEQADLPRRLPIKRAASRFVSGRKISDEYRYILERRDRKRFPGNQLPRPGLLLNPWDLGESSSSEDTGGEGSSMFVGKAKKRSGRLSEDDGYGEINAEEALVNLDFLPEQHRSFYNLKPDKNGVVEIDLEQLGGARLIRAIAIDGARSVTATRALPAARLEARDRRLQKIDQLHPRGRFTRARTATVLAAGEKLTIEHANSARYQIYNDLSDAFALLNAIGGDKVLDKFAFVLDWPHYDEGEKRRWYSDHACHELNLFLSRHDLKFFEAAVRPYLANKREKDFMDHYLLGNNLGGYLEEWRLVRLNAAERALLSRRLVGDASKRTAQSLSDAYDAAKLSNIESERLFETALASHALTLGDEVRQFNRAMRDMDELLFPSDTVNAGVEYIRQPLRTIIIPEIDFTDATIEEAIASLRQQSKELDPDGEGINMIIKLDEEFESEASINLQLTNVSLEDALRFTTELAGLKYIVDPLAVIIVPAWMEAGRLVTETYRVPPDFIDRLGGKPANAKEHLQEAGVPFPEGASAIYLTATSELVVRTTDSNHGLISAYTDSFMESVSSERGEAFHEDSPALFPSALAGADPGGDPFGGSDGEGALVDPFGDLVGDGGGGALLERRKAGRQFYRELGDTEEFAETHYYKLPMTRQGAQLVPVNAFWRDYAMWDGEGKFLSENLAAASSNFTEIMLALAVLDLPSEGARARLAQEGNQLTITAMGPAIVFVEQIEKAAKGEGSLVIGQRFFPIAEQTRYEDGEQVSNYIDEGFVKGATYGSRIVVTNPTARAVEFELLSQIPHGAIPTESSFRTRSTIKSIQAYATRTFYSSFYFPMAGKFTQYPAQVSVGGSVVASAPSPTFVVADGPGEVDGTSWPDLAARGSNQKVLAFLRTRNLNLYDLDQIAWRLKDHEFFASAIEIFRERQIYSDKLYVYGLLHDHPHAVRQFLLNSESFPDHIGGTIDSELLTVMPTERRLSQHVEYQPLVNARAHRVGNNPRIVNGRFQAQYDELMSLLARKVVPDDDDRLSIVYYLLLQDRIGEAIEFFDAIELGKLSTRLQYDYFRAYLDFYRDRPERARRIALGYKDHPVERWRKLFAQVASQADEILADGDLVVDDPRDREQKQARLAASSEALDLEIADRHVEIRHRNLAAATLNFYKMDLEFLFSANPFVDSDITRFRFIKPNLSRALEFVAGTESAKLPLPEEFRNENVLVEIVGGGKSKAHAYFANSLDVTIARSYGRLQVKHGGGGQFLPKTYIKVYARMSGGAVKFYKDGYTDLRGKFDYASVSADEPDLFEVEKFAILIMHEEFGALVEEVAPPPHRLTP